MCLFRAGRNDSGEENVPLDLTRGNAGCRGPRRGRAAGEESGLGAADRGGPRTGPAGVREPEPGAASPDPSPFPVPASLSPSSSLGLWVLWVSGSIARDLEQPATRWVPWTIEKAFYSYPGACAAESWGRPEGGRGCYLGCRRMSEGRATTSCPPRPPEQKPDLLAQFLLTAWLFSLPTALGYP